MNPCAKGLLNALEEVLRRCEASHEDEGVDCRRGDFGELVLEEGEDLVCGRVSGIKMEKRGEEDVPMMGSKTSCLMTRPGIASSP